MKKMRAIITKLSTKAFQDEKTSNLCKGQSHISEGKQTTVRTATCCK